jgi:hypothetical protein
MLSTHQPRHDNHYHLLCFDDSPLCYNPNPVIGVLARW